MNRVDVLWPTLLCSASVEGCNISCSVGCLVYKIFVLYLICRVNICKVIGYVVSCVVIND
jgi:hypothetical protein